MLSYISLFYTLLTYVIDIIILILYNILALHIFLILTFLIYSDIMISAIDIADLKYESNYGIDIFSYSLFCYYKSNICGYLDYNNHNLSQFDLELIIIKHMNLLLFWDICILTLAYKLIGINIIIWGIVSLIVRYIFTYIFFYWVKSCNV
jgi:hypothetical protein